MIAPSTMYARVFAALLRTGIGSFQAAASHEGFSLVLTTRMLPETNPRDEPTVVAGRG
jgi:hypothetical protein